MKQGKWIPLLALVVTLALPASAMAAQYPAKPIQVIVPAGPGGDTDINVRLLGQYMSKTLGQPLVVVNVTGAGGSTGTSRVKDAAPDGYTVLFFHPSTILNQLFGVTKYGLEAYEIACIPAKDTTNGYFVKSDSRFKTLQDLAKEIKEKPGTVNHATETGSFTYMVGTNFCLLAGGEFNNVDVGSQSAKNAAMLGGQFDVMCAVASAIQGFLKADQFRPLAFTSEQRHPAYPDVPTFKELGFDMIYDRLYFFAFPKGTPKDVIETFNASVRNALEDPGFKKKAAEGTVTFQVLETDAATAHLNNLKAHYEKVLAESRSKARK